MSSGGKGSVLGQIFVAVSVAVLAGGTSPWWLDKVFPKPTSTSTPTPSVTPTSTLSPSIDQGQRIWNCQAKNGNRVLYLVDQLDPNKDSFDLAIIENVNEYDQGAYFGTVSIQITDKSNGIVGSGRLGSRSIDVNALGRTPHFSVKDSVAGETENRCFINKGVKSPKEMERMRYCLSVVEKQNGNVSEVERFACESDPEKYIKELQSQKRSQTSDLTPVTPNSTASSRFNSEVKDWLRSKGGNKNR